MVIQSYTPGTFLSPSNLYAKNVKNNSIALQWADRSSDETGFEIWRAQQNNLTYTLIATVDSNVTAYNDSNITANTAYYYIVRAKKKQ